MALGAPASNHRSRDGSRTRDKHDSSNVMTASQASTARDSLLFPLQFTSTDDGYESLSDAHNSDQYDPVFELQKIQRALGSLSEGEVQLAQAVQEAKASSILTAGSVDLWSVGSYLRSKYGYLVSLRRANVSKRPKAYLRQLRHDFLVVRGLPAQEGGVDILVDLNFRDHFAVCHTTPWYSKMLAALPQDWVGSAAALAPIVGLMSAGIRLCFRQAAIPLPPWREGRAMLSKWVTELHSDEPLPVVPLPDPALRRLLAPYHTPFRSAVRLAGGPHASSAAAAAGGVNSPRADKQGAARPPSLGFNKAALPPLPPSNSSNSSSTAVAVTAAAPAAVLAVHHAVVRDSSHHHVPDVPHKIIVGFPVASLPSAQLQQQQQQLFDTASVCTAPAATAAHGIATSHPQLEAPSAPQQQQQQLSNGGGAVRGPVSAGTTAAAGTRPVAALVELSTRGANAAQATVACNSTVAPGTTAAATVRPAFSSTAGVVVATAGGTSPGIVINKQWIKQLTEGAMAAAAATTTVVADKAKITAAAAAAAAPVSTGGGGITSGTGAAHGGGGSAAATTTGAGPPAAAAAAAVAARQFKSLDQLLPRMRTVKLGAG